MSRGDDCSEPLPLVVEDKMLVTDDEEPTDLEDEPMTNVVVVERFIAARIGGPISRRFCSARCNTYAETVKPDVLLMRLHVVTLFLRVVVIVKFY